MAITQIRPNAVRMVIKVKPRTSPQGIVGLRDGHLVVNIQAPAIDGLANQALVSLIAKSLRIKKTEVLLVQGEKSRIKLLEVTGLSISQVQEKLGLETEKT